MSKITVVGIGPGSEADITPAAREALLTADLIVAYKYYIRFVKNLAGPQTEIFDSGMKRERERVAEAFRFAAEGKNVCIVSSGDAGIYGMAPLAYEMKRELGADVEISVVPGISAFQKAAVLLGAPIGHDFCIISLSDLMTPWATIERRIHAAAEADFVTAVYNPRSHDRYWQLPRLIEIFSECRSADTPVGYVRQAGRPEQKVSLTTIADFNPDEIDMFTIIIIGNSQTRIDDGRMVTPRGYYRETADPEAHNVGQSIMIESFRTIQREMADPQMPLYRKWPVLHAIHTTADFDMEQAVKVDRDAPERILTALTAPGGVRTIVTDVTMAASGIRKAALERMGIDVKCYLSAPRVATLATEEGITRTQAGIRLAVSEHPDALFVFGNAPTALSELCRLIHAGKAHPCGVVAAPVGFVHVCESKHMLKPFKEIPKIIVEGRKGGSNLAATLVNSILSWPDATNLLPGRDV